MSKDSKGFGTGKVQKLPIDFLNVFSQPVSFSSLSSSINICQWRCSWALFQFLDPKRLNIYRGKGESKALSPIVSSISDLLLLLGIFIFLLRILLPAKVIQSAFPYFIFLHLSIFYLKTIGYSLCLCFNHSSPGCWLAVLWNCLDNDDLGISLYIRLQIFSPNKREKGMLRFACCLPISQGSAVGMGLSSI